MVPGSFTYRSDKSLFSCVSLAIQSRCCSVAIDVPASARVSRPTRVGGIGSVEAITPQLSPFLTFQAINGSIPLPFYSHFHNSDSPYDLSSHSIPHIFRDPRNTFSPSSPVLRSPSSGPPSALRSRCSSLSSPREAAICPDRKSVV